MGLSPSTAGSALTHEGQNGTMHAQLVLEKWSVWEKHTSDVTGVLGVWCE